MRSLYYFEMKHSIVYIIVFIICSWSKLPAQNQDTVLKLAKYSFSTNALANDNGLYIDYHFGNDFNTTGAKKSFIFRLDSNLNIIDSLCVSCLSLSGIKGYLTVQMASDHSNKLYIPLRGSNSDSLSTDLIILDSSLTQIRSVKINVPFDLKSTTYSFRELSVQDSLIYFVGWTQDSSKNTADAFILSTDYNGSIVNHKTIYSDSLSNGPRWITFNSIAVLDSVILASINFAWSEYLAVFDRALNLLKIKDLSDANVNFGYGQHQHFVKNIIKHPRLQAISFVADFNRQPGRGEDYWYKNLALISLDSSYSIFERDTFSYKGWQYDTLTNFLEIPQYGTASYGFYSEDTIVTMATEELTSVNWPLFEFLNYPTTTHIGCLETTSQTVLWNKVFNNGIAHMAEEVTALPNNRWLLTFNEYDWNTYGPDNLAVRLIVIDGNGNPIGINEDEEKALAQEPIVYPNPANDYLTVANLHWPGNDYTYQISDANGRVVQKGALPIGGNITLAENLHGIYVLTITNQTGFGWARKVVLE
jgi:hypothetical protein